MLALRASEKEKAMQELKPIPEFKSEDEEREFWATHDSAEYVDWSEAELAGPFPNLKRTEGLLELMLPASIIPKLKALAKKQLMSSEELAQRYIAEGLARDSGQ